MTGTLTRMNLSWFVKRSSKSASSRHTLKLVPLINILIAEDDAVSAAVLQKIVGLQPENKTTVATDGAAAWALLDDPGRSFDILFLDLNLPKLSGFEVWARVRESSQLKSLQVVFCTASNDRDTVNKAVSLGARHYLVKPCTEQNVTAKLQQLQQLRDPRRHSI